MTNFYRRQATALPFILLCLFLLGFQAEVRAQQPLSSTSKMSPNDPLLKIGPELAALQNGSNARRANTQLQSQVKGLTKKSLLQIQGDHVVIEAMAEPNQTAQLLSDLTVLGMTKSASYGGVISGLIPIKALDQVAALKNLRFARPAYKPFHNIGKVTTQGDVAMYADSARKHQLINGKGSKIGVLSDSYNNFGVAEAGVKSGDLPGIGNPNGYTTPVQVLQDDIYFSNVDEGRAMMEIIHDVAPGAELAFHTAFLGQASFAKGILDLQKAGCNIITDDVIYLNEPMFQDGIIAQAIDEVKQKGSSFFSAAGNNARQSYQATFKNSGKAIVVNGVNYGIAHDFGNGDVTQSIRIPKSGSLVLPLQWADPFFSVSGLPGAQTDLDLLFFYQGRLLTSSSDKNIGNDPFEYINLFTDSTFTADVELVIVKYSGPDPKLIKWVDFGNSIPLEHVTNSPTIYGHSNAAGAISTGAVFFGDTPAYGTPEPIAEDFSSAGGIPILFDVDGNSKKAEVRQKPEIMAPDGVNTTFFYNLIDGKYYFFGTSAAAPHAAAVAALMQEANGNSLDPDQIKETLQKTALDMNEPGFDFDTGHGFINAFAAVEAVAKSRIRYFSIVNAKNGKTIQTIKEGSVINLTRLPTSEVLVRAFTGPAKVGSVEVALNGEKAIENLAPYDFPGSSGAFVALKEGDYTITATPYSMAAGKGEKGIPLTIHFNAVEEEVERFDLINVATGEVIRELKNNDELNLATLPPKLNVRAIVEPAVVGSVQFNLNGLLVTENQSYYEVAGSSGKAIDFAPGDFTLSATIYPKTGARGEAGGTRTINFKVVDGQVADANTNTTKESINYTAYPNPSTESVRIKFDLPETGKATLAVYDLSGRLISVLHDGETKAGKQYEYVLDGRKLHKGLYISRLITAKGVHNTTLKIDK